MRLPPVMIAALLVVAACGGEQAATVASTGDGSASTSASPSTSPSTSTTPGTDMLYGTTTVVLSSAEHGPQLCLAGLLESHPPQCGGPNVVGWSWDAVEGEESASGTTWGSYSVVGTWDGKALTLTKPAAPAAPSEPSDRDRPRFETPCPEPKGGWQVIDEPKSSQRAMDEAIAYAKAQPTVGGVWVDQSIDKSIDPSSTLDPTKLILNLSFIADLEQHGRAVRGLWGGALCVSQAPASAARLGQIRTEVEAAADDFLSSSTDDVHGRVHIGVAVDGGLQQRFDERYGQGIVRVEAQLRPVPA